MSIPLLVRTISPKAFARARTNPSEVEAIMLGPQVKIVEGVVKILPPPGQPKKGFVQRLLGLAASPFPSVGPVALFAVIHDKANTNFEALRESGWEVPANDDCLDMDKSYEGLHPMLTGKELEPIEGPSLLGCLYCSGIQLGAGNEGGPFWGLDHEQVVRLNDELANITEESLRSSYKPELIGELSFNPDFWTERSEESLAYALEYFTKFKTLVQRTASSNKALMFHLWI